MAFSDFLKWHTVGEVPPASFSGSGSAKLSIGPSEQKLAYDIQRVGVVGRPQFPDTDIRTLQRTYTRNEMVYAAINRKASAAIGPRLLVETRATGKGTDGDEWQEQGGHPLRRLLMRPNPEMAEADFLRAYIVSMDVAGEFYAEIVRNKQTNLPEALYPLDPAKMQPLPDSKGMIPNYLFKDGQYKVVIPAANMLVRKYYSPLTPFRGLSPLAVCMGSVDADQAQTDFIRSFFNNAGVPSGILKVLGRKLTQAESEGIKAQWETKYGRTWDNQHSLAVLDENAEYQKIGSGLNELASQDIRSFTESRVSMVFDVPPLIIYAYVGLLRATYSNLKEAWRGFWDATLTPFFTHYADWLMWELLPEFVNKELVYGEKVRLNWDFRNVVWLQEDVDAKQNRARLNLAAGGITLNEFREEVGEMPDEQGDYYIRAINTATQLSQVLPNVTMDDVMAGHWKVTAGVLAVGEGLVDADPAAADTTQTGNQVPPPEGVAVPVADTTKPVNDTTVPTKPKLLLPDGFERKARRSTASRARIEKRIEREISAIIAAHYEAAAKAVETG